MRRSNSQKGRLSQRKGKEFAYLIAQTIANRLNVTVHLNPHQAVGQDVGRDLLVEGLPFCFQLSHGARINPYEKLGEARWSARENEWPVAILRRNNRPVIAVMYLEDFLDLLERRERDEMY